MVQNKDFTAALENIIVKYNIDEGYPDFRKYLRAKNAIDMLFRGYTPENKLAFVAVHQIDADMLHPYVHKYALLSETLMIGLPSSNPNYSKLERLNPPFRRLNIHSNIILKV